PSLEAFGRRPRCKPNRRHGPSSETLHRSGHSGSGLAGGAIAARQTHNELSKRALLGLNVDLAPVLLDDDIMGYRQPEAGPFPRRFGGEEGIEHPLPHLRRNTRTVVSNPNFNRISELFSDCAQHRLEVSI